MRQVDKDDMMISIKDDNDTKQMVYDRIVEFFLEHDTYSGESMCQCDGPIIAAPDMLGDIADILFSVQYKH